MVIGSNRARAVLRIKSKADAVLEAIRKWSSSSHSHQAAEREEEIETGIIRPARVVASKQTPFSRPIYSRLVPERPVFVRGRPKQKKKRERYGC